MVLEKTLRVPWIAPLPEGNLLVRGGVDESASPLSEAVLGPCPQAFPAAGGWVGYPP